MKSDTPSYHGLSIPARDIFERTLRFVACSLASIAGLDLANRQNMETVPLVVFAYSVRFCDRIGHTRRTASRKASRSAVSTCPVIAGKPARSIDRIGNPPRGIYPRIRRGACLCQCLSDTLMLGTATNRGECFA